MKKIIPHILYLFVIAFFIVYANIKASEADKQSAAAQAASEQAAKNAEDAKKQAEFAHQNAAEARKQAIKTQLLQEQLEECQGKK